MANIQVDTDQTIYPPAQKNGVNVSKAIPFVPLMTKNLSELDPKRLKDSQTESKVKSICIFIIIRPTSVFIFNVTLYFHEHAL